MNCTFAHGSTGLGKYGCHECDVQLVMSAWGNRGAAGALLAAIEWRMGLAYRREIAEMVKKRLEVMK